MLELFRPLPDDYWDQHLTFEEQEELMERKWRCWEWQPHFIGVSHVIHERTWLAKVIWWLQDMQVREFVVICRCRRFWVRR